MAILRIKALARGRISPRDKAIRDWVDSYRRNIKSEYPGAVFETEFVLGCTIPEFIVYIESKFQPGMTWENKKDKWVIKAMRVSTDLKRGDPAIFYRYFHYTNMVPMWKKVRGFIADPFNPSPLDRDGDQV